MTAMPGFKQSAGYPKPITHFPVLAKLAVMAAAFITNSNPVESNWSLLAGRHYANVWHVGSEYVCYLDKRISKRQACSAS
jgi:hypothetical protein